MSFQRTRSTKGEIMKLIALVFIALFAGSPSGCEKDLNKGLQEQKSYTRAAMEKYRQDPKYFQGSSPDVLEIWSRMDYVALDVAKQNIPASWAGTADKLEFVQPKMQRDTDGKPFCVIEKADEIIVLRIVAESVTCSAELTTSIDSSRIRSGDMEFSGRANYWVYVLRPRQNGNKSDR